MTKMSNSCYKMNEENPLKLKKDSLYLHLHKLSIKLSFFSERFIEEPYKSVSDEGPGSDLAPTVTDHSGLPTGPSGSACPVGVNHWTPTAVEGAFVVLLAPLPRSLMSLFPLNQHCQRTWRQQRSVRGSLKGKGDGVWCEWPKWKLTSSQNVIIQPKKVAKHHLGIGKTRRQEKYQSCTDRVNPWTKISKRLIVTT